MSRIFLCLAGALLLAGCHESYSPDLPGEFVGGSPFWGMLFCAAGAWAFHGLFIAFDPRDPDAATKDEE